MNKQSAKGVLVVSLALLLFLPLVKAPVGSEYDVIAPIEFNTKTTTPTTPVWGGSILDGEIPEKPKPPAPIAVSGEAERSWIGDAVLLLILGVSAFFAVLLIILWRHGGKLEDLKKRIRGRF